MKIFKYTLSLGAPTFMTFPDPTKMLMFQIQRGVPTIWCEIEENSAAPTCNLEYRVLATGDEIPVGMIHLGSAISGDFVWHLYYRVVSTQLNEDELLKPN